MLLCIELNFENLFIYFGPPEKFFFFFSVRVHSMRLLEQLNKLITPVELNKLSKFLH